MCNCDGSPVRDGYRGVEILLETWIGPGTHYCSAMTCLE